MIRNGDIYWLVREADRRVAHPRVVVHTDGETVVVCALTTNAKKISMPGNIVLEAGEGNLPKRSIVEVSKDAIHARSELGLYVGTLSDERVAEIHAGMRFVGTFRR